TESSLYGPARNPWDPDHSPGGSSGGAAVAVAARMVPIAHANDGGGSIRIPAACCGLVGLKPTRARTPLGPQFGDVMSGLVVEHVITRSVRDSAVMFDVTAGPDIGDPYCAPPQPGRYLDAIAVPPRRLRIAFSVLDPFGQEIDPECRAAVINAAKLCADLGHEVEQGEPPIEVGKLASDFMSICVSGLAALIDGIAHFTGKPPAADCFQGLTWSLYKYGRTVSAAQYLMGWTALQGAARRIALWHQLYDVWLTAILSRPPARIGEFDVEVHDWAKGYEPFVSYAPLTALQNATGQPAISVPMHRTSDDLPIGVQFVGRFGDEQLLLQLAAQLEQAKPWNKHEPTG
ncbi:MAG: amidase family protein, partial [Rhodoplanes sp.]